MCCQRKSTSKKGGIKKQLKVIVLGAATHKTGKYATFARSMPRLRRAWGRVSKCPQTCHKMAPRRVEVEVEVKLGTGL